MRALPLLLVLASCTATPPHADGGDGLRIVSTNPCSDAILLELAPPGQIAAISLYSQDPGSSSIPPEVARKHRGIAGTAEEVIALSPDIAILSAFDSAATRDALHRSGIRTLALGMPATVAESRAQIREIARAIDAPGRGEALIARIDEAVERGSSAAHPPLPALLWHGGGMASGSGTLIDELMTRAGFRNVSAAYGITFTNILPLEPVLLDPPRVMLTPVGGSGGEEESRILALRHRAAAHLTNTSEAAFPENLSYCGGPTIIRAMDRLAEIRREFGS